MLLFHQGDPYQQRKEDILLEKIRQQVLQATGGLTGIEQSLRKLGARGGELVSQEELLLALCRSNATLSIDEVKDFFSYVASISGQKDDYVSIKDVM